MFSRCRTIALWGVLAVVLLGRSPLPASAQDNAQCQKCHGSRGLQVERDGRVISLHVDSSDYARSVHSGLECVGCHAQLDGVEEYPHAVGLDRVDCMACHEDDDGPIAAYLESTHGKMAEAGSPLAPRCQDCHGGHAILPLADPASAISPFNIPAMCAQCHAEDAPVARAFDLPQEQILRRYTQSIHGEGLYKQGLSVTAVCTSCHTGHHVLPHTDERSTIHRNNVRATCMKCHGQIEAVHRKVIGGELWEKQGAVPICVECHSPHEARRVFYDTNMSNADCQRCHGQPELRAADDGRSLFVDAAEFGRSIHARSGVSCAQCHSEVTPSEERSCQTITRPVDCATCHQAEVDRYRRGVHGKLIAAGDRNAPSCQDCHGRHDTLEHAVPEGATQLLKTLVRSSPTYSRNVPDLCGGCHREGGAAAQRYLGTEDHILERYAMSIHGKGLLESGLTVTAVCTDCHTAHLPLAAADPESTVNEQHIASTCGKCHDGIYEQYQHSVHSPVGNPDYVQLRGMAKMPSCSDCHSSHAVARTDVPRFKLDMLQQCGSCHPQVTQTYFETFHGKASALGDDAKAKCYDCHGAHDIMPPTDPRSHLHRDHIVATCAKCHPGSHRQFAGYLTHATHHDSERYPVLFYTFWGMTLLLTGTLLFFATHAVVWFPRAIKWRRELQHAVANSTPKTTVHVVRFTRYQRALHLMVIVSFFGLAITGMMLKFSYTAWAQWLAWAMGGMSTAGVVHRACAIITFLYFGLHLRDLLRRYRASRQTLWQFATGPDSIMPTGSDVREFAATMRWFLGRGPRPEYGKWTYWEKFDYLAVFWGVAIIGSTGLCLWFPELFTRVLPGWSINVATIIHSDEALLATGFIFTIHFFNSHFRPDKFPMDDVIFTGTVPLDELRHDRPRWYAQLKASGDLERLSTTQAHSPRFARAARIFGFCALACGLALIGLILYAMVFAYR